jgi:hypothetical protein
MYVTHQNYELFLHLFQNNKRIFHNTPLDLSLK